MNKTLAMLIGAGVGGSLGWFVGSVVVEIIKLKEFPWEDYEYEDLDEDPGNDDETNEGKAPVKKSQRVKNYSEYFSKIGRPDIAELTMKYNEGKIEGESPSGITIEDGVEDEFEVPEDEVDSDFRIVSLAEFANSDLECVTVSYYDDDVVTDANNVPIRNPEEIIGEEALLSFGVLSEDENTVYIHNTKKDVMYEVVRTNQNFGTPRDTYKYHRNKRLKEEKNAEEDNT